MTDIKASLKLRQHEGWKETSNYIERLEKALGVARDALRYCKDCKTDEGAHEALKEISKIMGGG